MSSSNRVKNPVHIPAYPIEKLIPYARNARTHSEAQVAQIAASIKEFGFTNPVLIDAEDGIIAGHGRVLAAQKLELLEVPCIRLAYLTENQKRAYVIADNKLALNASWDNEMLRLELEALRVSEFDLDLTGYGEAELLDILGEQDSQEFTRPTTGVLAGKFMIAPFSVLNAREAWWLNRKKSWVNLGIESELGRSDSLISDGGKKMAYGKSSIGTGKDGELLYRDSVGASSVFDPVLSELVYRWFSKEGSCVLDPFAGGSVRGIVASKLNRKYVGHELRAEQVHANEQQALDLCKDDQYKPVYIVGDSIQIHQSCADVKADLIFSCPPYADLEVYSNLPGDISRMKYPEFKAAYFEIINKTCALLENDRFACFVVGEVRDKKGNYLNFVGDTVQAFLAAGLSYYNEAILVTPCGTLALRAGKGFTVSRKLGKSHQNVLVFVKGDAKKAADYCGLVEFDESLFEEEAEEEPLP